MKIGTLSELGALPGDTVESIDSISFGRVTLGDPAGTGFSYVNTEMESLGCVTSWRMIRRRPRTWCEMTDAEKGALLLACYAHGKTIQTNAVNGTWVDAKGPLWDSACLYRIKPEPVVETHKGTCFASMYSNIGPHLWLHEMDYTAPGKWTCDAIDGVPQKITWERIDA